MSDPKQADRPISVKTPLGADKLLLIGISGQEAVSKLFLYQLEVLAKVGTPVAFDKLLGQSITAEMQFHPSEPKKRYLNGICCRISEKGQSDEFTTYQLDVVPKFWLATRKAQSRIFQQMSVPDILKKVLDGIDTAFELQGTFEKRDYCVQYRETDFNFACRLMEEEGIFFFFKHVDGSHKMVIANTPQSHSETPDGSKLIYETVAGGNRPEDRIYDWQKQQELRSGKYLLWDHTFELPHKHLEADRDIQDSVQVGEVTHKLKVGGNDNLEIYDYPGEYAQRFDGVNPGGGDQASELQKIFQDNNRTVEIRMQEEAAASIVIQGASTCRQLVSGHKFKLERHFNADGEYLLRSVSHTVKYDAYRSGSSGEFHYTNQFTVMPFALPFRPARVTPKPVIHGTQSAVVVGPPGEEIWPDKYGRIKVQFHWDREGKNNEKSSCWIRVTTSWAGKQWGGVCIPRVGQEVIVAFQEGDPDQPIVVGSVYNYEQMPPFKLPEGKAQMGMKSRSHKGGGFNEISIDDTSGKEKITIHGQHDMGTTVEHDDTQTVHNNRTITVDGKHTETVKKDMSIQITEGNLIHDVLAGTASYHVAKAVEEFFDDTQTTVVKNKVTIQSSGDEIFIDAASKITLLCGASAIVLEKDGTITINGKTISIGGTSDVEVFAPTTSIGGQKEASMSVGSNSYKCDPAGVTTSGAMVTASAQGVHNITGALVKIN